MTIVSMNYLLEAGVHFGHQKRRWNPKMKEYIYTTRDDIYIIDLQKTVKKLEEAYEAMKEIAQNGGSVLFVGTKKQAQEAAEECATRTNMYFVNERWLGGTLTNFKTIRSRIKRMEEIEKMEQEGVFEMLPKKEVIQIKKEYDKLNKNLRGIREMKKMPQALVIVDPRKEEIAFAQSYFAQQTRKQELIEEHMNDMQRIDNREKLRESEKRLSKNIFERNVDNAGYARIRSAGDSALFGKSTQAMKDKYGVNKNRPLADFLPNLTIAAKNLATEMTNYNTEAKDLYGEPSITHEHVQNNSTIRNMLGERGIKPENLPPAEDIKKIERRVKSNEKS